jgi:hypothetical protein
LIETNAAVSDGSDKMRIPAPWFPMGNYNRRG